MMTSDQIRASFLDYFHQRDHVIVPSGSLIPIDDPTLLFTNAGMNQFKDVFLGLGERNYKRAADTQKCIRVSGKHNDLEEVGYDGHHHTFFEMLGNWSFGDYYKREAISFAWELITEVWKIPKEKLWATIYLDDDEAEKMWIESTDLPADRILRFDEKENFWEMGETGPCGPCSELFIDLGPEADPNFEGEPRNGINVSDRFLEFWNLVFIQYNRDENGKLHPLPETHVDTGMGFERIVAIMQGANSNYKTDIFIPLLDEIANLTNQGYSDDGDGVPHRVIADHVRCLTFAISDGVMPSNEGRGYVMRRILRRSVLYGKKLGMSSPFIFNLVDTVIDQLGGVFPNVLPRQDFIKEIIKGEEHRFHQTLDRGLDILDGLLNQIETEGKSVLLGDQAFELYDTFGFPLDLTQVLANERNFSVDEDGFSRSMDKQRNRSRTAWKTAGETGYDSEILSEILRESGKTEFLGYQTTQTQAEITAIIRQGELTSAITKGDEVSVILSRTPFYGESGGQVGDTGTIEAKSGKLNVIDTRKPTPDLLVHRCKVIDGNVTPHIIVSAQIDRDRRQKIAISHTTTHILHNALRTILGDHVGQAGSLVEPERLRFDFTHYEAVNNSQICEIEALVNQKIRANSQVAIAEMPLQKAKDRGALAFFGDKYGDIVRMVEIGDYSIELCGGTHINATGEIGFVKITGESSIAAGTRRIEALTSESAYLHQQNESNLLKNISGILKLQRDQIPERIEKLLDTNRDLERQIKALRSKMTTTQTAALVDEVISVNGVSVLAKVVENTDRSTLRNMVDNLKRRLSSGVVVIASINRNDVSFIAGVTSDLVDSHGLKAGNIIKEVTKIAGGSGGGRPDLAQGGSKDPSQTKTAINAVTKIVAAQI
ncbi:TPA: alanine--tRNA ligase [Candidatus Poribacteria bacterium]|nr:alanine--tRNA ligase [Candidatus Poribacteria bacterium]